MEMKFSPKGIPYIEFDENTKMIFTRITKNDKCYKWVSVNSARKIIPKKRNGRSFREVTERVDFMADVHLNGFPKGFTGDETHSFTKKKYTFLRKVFRKYIVEDKDCIPDKAITKIADDLFLYKEPKKRLVKSKKKRVKRVTKLTDKTLAKSKAEKEKKREKELKKAERALKKREKEVKDIEKKLSKKPKRKKKKLTKMVENKLSKTCKACDSELFTVASCGSQMLVGHGERWMPVVYKGKKPCKACGVFAGGRHHLYCPHEECPRCKGKFATCGCF